MNDLFGDIIRTEQLSKIKENLKGGATVVKFSDPSGQIHFLPCEKCQTWFVRAPQYARATVQNFKTWLGINRQNW